MEESSGRNRCRWLFVKILVADDIQRANSNRTYRSQVWDCAVPAVRLKFEGGMVKDIL